MIERDIIRRYRLSGTRGDQWSLGTHGDLRIKDGVIKVITVDGLVLFICPVQIQK